MSRCETWPATGRCSSVAVWEIRTPEGRRTSWQCDFHGRAIVEEYAEKLGETWTLVAVDQHGSLIHPTSRPNDAHPTNANLDLFAGGAA